MAVKSVKKSEVAPITDLNLEFTQYKGFVLTKKGSLIGAIELKGVDPDGLQLPDLEGLSVIARSFYQHLDSDTIVSEYYAHYDGVECDLKPRSDAVSNLLSERRKAFINDKGLSQSKIVHFFEIMPSEKLNRLGVADLIFHFFKAYILWDKDSKEVIKRHFSSVESVICYFDELERQANLLQSQLTDLVARWDGLFNASLLNIDQQWSFMKFLANLDPYYLDQYRAKAPINGLDVALSDGDKVRVDIDNMTCIKCQGTETKYARVLSVNNIKGNARAGMFASTGTFSPVLQQGNYVIMVRYKPFTRLQQGQLFSSKTSEVNRRNYDLSNILSSNKPSYTEKERRELMKPALRKALDDIGDAEMLDELYGRGQISVVVFGDNGSQIQKQSIVMKRALDRVNIDSNWESENLEFAFKGIQVAGFEFNMRKMNWNISELSATSLLYAPAIGQQQVRDLNNEEAQYVFVGDDGAPFYYSPYVNGRSVVIGIGPIRSGKSFTKNTIGSHFMKYNGFLQGIDVDKGMEPVARSFGDNGGIFRIENDADVGFNPFVSMQGEDDILFVEHLRSMIIAMVKTNDTPEMQTVTAEEQLALDNGIVATMKLDKKLHRLSTVIRHCPESLQQKMARWIYDSNGENDGMYAKYFDAKEDAIGAIDKRVMAYNLRSIKDQTQVLPLVMAEIFFRITRIFEDIKQTDIPKYLDIDEAHIPLSIDYIADFIVRYIRTSGKYTAGIGLWSHTPLEFESVKNWNVIRQAASTLFFMADASMNDEDYKRVFKLTSGECEAIRNLKPQREAFIIQRDLGIAKKVILEVEPEQYVVSTSKGSETKIRDSNFENFGFERGLDKTMKDLGLVEQL